MKTRAKKKQSIGRQYFVLFFAAALAFMLGLVGSDALFGDAGTRGRSGVNTAFASTGGRAPAFREAVEQHDSDGQEHSPAAHADQHSTAASDVHGESDAAILTPQINWRGWLPVALVFLPLAAAFLIPFFRSSQAARDSISVGTSMASFLIILAMFEPVVRGVTLHGHFYRGIYLSLPFFQGFAASFKVDPAALLVAGVTSFLWILSTIHAISYMTIEDKRVRYEFFVLSSLAMNLGVLMAGDFLTLFVFFEGMVIFPYALIAHKEDEGAVRGANMYLYLGVATSLCLFFGIIFLHKYTGSIDIRPFGPEITAKMPGASKYILAALMIAGFGGKAGVFMEHIWLPQAHPVAPTPASCLLSGAMIKAGAYGIFRVVNMIIAPIDWSVAADWATSRNVGYAVIWLGVVTMFFGVLNALISSNSKRMLAYHSVSQMGYIVLGIGCAAFLGADGAMGMAGALYHIVNHALFKASLFLTVGAVYFRTHELDMYRLGGLWRNMPFTCVAMLIAACGIAGIPGFNGFASKTILHHSILEAYEHSAHYTADGLPDFKLRIAEIIFMITAGGTFASNMKLWVFDFLGKRPAKYEKIKPAPMSMKISLGLVSAVIIFLGLFPNWLIENMIGPALAYFNFNPASHPYHILYNVHAAQGVRSTIPLLYNPLSSGFLTDSAVVHNLLGCGDALIFGGVIFVLGLRMGWFHSTVPEYLTVAYYYRGIYHGFKWACKSVFAKLDKVYNQGWEMLIFGRGIATVVLKSTVGPDLWGTISRLEDKFSEALDTLIYSQSMMSVVDAAGMEGSDHSDIAMASHSPELNSTEKEVWQELGKLDEKYGKAFERAIFGHGIHALVGRETNEEEKVWRELSKLEEKYENVFDKMLLSANMEKMLKAQTTNTAPSSVLGRWWSRFCEFDKLNYNRNVDQLLFGNTDPNAKPVENSFMKFCRQISSVHSGDIGRYISWIIVALSIVVALLVGNLYVTSFLGTIVLLSVILFIMMAVVSLSF